MLQSTVKTPKQKEILAQFYSNLALVVIAGGIVTPLLTSIGKIDLFILRSLVSIGGAVALINLSLKFLK
ncbi:hypothetical protein A2954_04700 [Candidatus Roizmanbacteria bacterium RIFCSPLOWO2_01_FULL_37_12]|uniref:Uncharacterized protein n=1 Tax=Candidatus Roizmanbacteria bacterium RIFCSPLOWO2_01_FULL_37_12 TaxID=1802056 RepID=A0A1F7IFY7_9BACT|nr:MAG: hypothetical protein A3D76_03835 [Candidatus Roizmanbacteria bacterium RIFCSPHIGHO2_02_FULL_37_9b]OGK42279.1 MAG: hypothetical protein A2954_04700 [Candidatus Roizmanbacteria bacterium RIFCSPLOWO2_01_FULL_37_12]